MDTGFPVPVGQGLGHIQGSGHTSGSEEVGKYFSSTMETVVGEQ